MKKRKERKFWPRLFKNLLLTVALIIALLVVFIVFTTFTSIFS